MKKVLFIICINWLSFNLIAQWLPDVRLTTEPSDSYLSYNNAHCIAVNGSTIHVVWWDTRDSDGEIYYKASTDNGVTWQSDVRLTNSTGGSEYPSIAVSGSNVHIVWMDERDENYHPEIYYKHSTDNGINWSADERLTFNPSEPGIPSIVVSGSDVHIVWHDIRDGNWEIYYKRSIDNGLTWQSDIRLTNNSAVSERTSIGVSGIFPDEDLYVVWQDERDSDKELYFKKSSDAGTTWSEDHRLTNSIGESETPSIACEDSAINVCWSDNRNGIGDAEIYFKCSMDGGLNWSEDIIVTNTQVASGRPSISVSNYLVHITWSEVYEIYYTRSTDHGLTWETETRITNNSADSENPFIVTSDSIVHIIWQDQMSGHDDIYYKQNPTGNIITRIVDNDILIPSKIQLSQNYPNPFNPSTKISWQSPVSRWQSLKVYDVLGNEITTLVDEEKPAGSYEVEFNANNFSSGVYFYQLKAGNYLETKKMILLK